MSKVTVRFLKNVSSPIGSWKSGEIVDLEEKLAEQLCTPVKYADREEFFVKAIKLGKEEIDSEGKVVIPITDLTVADMHTLSVKNVVKTPADPEYDRYLEGAGAVKTDANEKNRKNRLEKRQQMTQSPD